MYLPTRRVSTSWRRSFLVFLTLLTVGCADQRNKPECGDVFKSRLDESGFDVLGRGIALHKKSSLTVTQCAVGQKLVNYRCRGEALKLNWDDAMAYAAEVAEKLARAGDCPQKLKCQNCLRPNA